LLSILTAFQYLQLKKAFPWKNLPSAPPKGLMRLKSKELLEEVVTISDALLYPEFDMLALVNLYCDFFSN